MHAKHKSNRQRRNVENKSQKSVYLCTLIAWSVMENLTSLPSRIFQNPFADLSINRLAFTIPFDFATATLSIWPMKFNSSAFSFHSVLFWFQFTKWKRKTGYKSSENASFITEQLCELDDFCGCQLFDSSTWLPGLKLCVR